MLPRPVDVAGDVDVELTGGAGVANTVGSTVDASNGTVAVGIEVTALGGNVAQVEDIIEVTALGGTVNILGGNVGICVEVTVVSGVSGDVVVLGFVATPLDVGTCIVVLDAIFTVALP